MENPVVLRIEAYDGFAILISVLIVIGIFVGLKEIFGFYFGTVKNLYIYFKSKWFKAKKDKKDNMEYGD